MSKYEEMQAEIRPIEEEFADWLEENQAAITREDLYNKIDSYKLSTIAKMHLAHSAGRALWAHGYR